MRITYIQTSLHWEQPEANRRQLAEKIATVQGRTDLIVLPEMFTTGFSMRAEALAEPANGPTFQWLKEQAANAGAAVTGSFICVENGQFFNRLLWMQPDGHFYQYNKKHLFTLAGEDKTYSAGQELTLIEWKGWRIRPLICYDLRFPEWARQPQNPDHRYDLLLYVANWPQPRVHHWKSLLTARAIENQAYVAGVNITGTDGNDLVYSGDSSVVDYAGQLLACAAFSEQITTLELSLEPLRTYRQRFAFLEDM
jgi:omega-amidase